MNLIPLPSWTSLNVALLSATPLAQRWANPAHTHTDTQTRNYEAKQLQTALKYVTKPLKAVCATQNQRQHLFFLVTLWFFFLLKPKWIFFPLNFVFAVHVDVSRVMNTRLKMSVVVEHVCRRAAFSPQPTTGPTWSRSVCSPFPSLFRKHRWFVSFHICVCSLWWTRDQSRLCIQ